MISGFCSLVIIRLSVSDSFLGCLYVSGLIVFICCSCWMIDCMSRIVRVSGVTGVLGMYFVVSM